MSVMPGSLWEQPSPSVSRVSASPAPVPDRWQSRILSQAYVGVRVSLVPMFEKEITSYCYNTYISSSGSKMVPRADYLPSDDHGSVAGVETYLQSVHQIRLTIVNRVISSRSGRFLLPPPPLSPRPVFSPLLPLFWFSPISATAVASSAWLSRYVLSSRL